MDTYTQPLNSRDIARCAGVSQATVSRVLSGSPKVKAETRDKVLQVMKDLGYQPNVFAQAMKTRHSGTIGVVVSRMTNPIVPEILLRLANLLTAHGRRMIVWNTDTEGDEGVVNAIRQKFVDGLIFTAAGQQPSAMAIALEAGMPIACINRHLDGAACDQIVGTNFEGGRMLADYLVGAGRRHVAMINGPHDRSTLAEREAGLRQGLKEAGRDLPDTHYGQADFDHEAFRSLALEMMDRRDPPDAIVCGNDVIAFAVLCGLRAAGCSVPRDVWVTGFDGIEMTGWDVFDLTTIRQPLDEMTKATVETLLKRIDKTAEAPRTIRFETDLIIRGTTDNSPYTNLKTSPKGG